MTTATLPTAAWRPSSDGAASAFPITPGRASIAAIPAELTRLTQWVCWRAEPAKTAGTKPDKVPYSVRLRHASSTDPRTWSSFAAVVRAWQARPDFFTGFGFVFSERDPYVGIDFDNCLDEQGCFCDPWAEAWVRRLRSYTEISPSGRGVKVWVRGSLPAAVKTPRIELYASGRYFTVTGCQLPGTRRPASIRAAQAELDALFGEVGATRAAAPARQAHVLDQDTVQRELTHIGRLLDDEGLPRRLTQRSSSRQLLRRARAGWPSGAPDYSRARYELVAGLILHGYPDAEIVALLEHFKKALNGGGKTDANWDADIARSIEKLRPKYPEVIPTPSRDVVTTSSPTREIPPTRGTPPAKPTRARKDRPTRTPDVETYMAWLHHEKNSAAVVLRSVSERAAHWGCSVRSIQRLESELRAAGRIESRAYAQRQAGCLVILGDDPRGDNIDAETPAEAAEDVVTRDAQTYEMAQSDATNADQPLARRRSHAGTTSPDQPTEAAPEEVTPQRVTAPDSPPTGPATPIGPATPTALGTPARPATPPPPVYPAGAGAALIARLRELQAGRWQVASAGLAGSAERQGIGWPEAP